MMTDDQGFGDFGVQGNPVIRTPHLDAMAGRSASMSTFYVSPVCSPTRACLMTGRYNYRTRVVDTWVGRSMMDPSEVTVGRIVGRGGLRDGDLRQMALGRLLSLASNGPGIRGVAGSPRRRIGATIRTARESTALYRIRFCFAMVCRFRPRDIVPTSTSTPR